MLIDARRRGRGLWGRASNPVWTVLEDWLKHETTRRYRTFNLRSRAARVFLRRPRNTRPRKLEADEDAAEKTAKWRLKNGAICSTCAGNAIGRGSLGYPIVIAVYYGMFWLSRARHAAARFILFVSYVRRVNESAIIVNAGAKLVELPPRPHANEVPLSILFACSRSEADEAKQ